MGIAYFDIGYFFIRHPGFVIRHLFSLARSSQLENPGYADYEHRSGGQAHYFQMAI